jgi:hypothetical protein
MNKRIYLKIIFFVIIAILAFSFHVSAASDITAFSGIGGNISGLYNESLCPGDGNGDGVVDQLDVDAVNASLGFPSCGPGDLDDNCIVNNYDALIVVQNLGNVCNVTMPSNLSIGRIIISTWIENSTSKGKDQIFIEGVKDGKKFRLVIRSFSISIILNTPDYLVYSTESKGVYKEAGSTTKSINYTVYHIVDRNTDKISIKANAPIPLYSFTAENISARFFSDIY